MTDQPYIDDMPDPAAFTQAALRRQVEVLERLTEAALELAAAIKDQAIYGGGAAAAAMPFSRVARAVRMTALLQSRLLKDMDEARIRNRLDPDSEEGMIAAAQESLRLDPERHLRKVRVERIVDRVAKAHTDDEERIGRLMIEAGERLDDDDIYGDILTKPVGELVALICRDLGLDPDWTRLAQEAWAKEEIGKGAWTYQDLALSPLPLEGGEVGSGGECTTLKREAPEAASPLERHSPRAVRAPPSPPFPPRGEGTAPLGSTVRPRVPSVPPPR